MARELKRSGGRILMWRLGNLNFQKQHSSSHAPEKWGIWAFPWPYYDEFFTFHQYRTLLPKRFAFHKEYPAVPLRTSWVQRVNRESELFRAPHEILDPAAYLNTDGLVDWDAYQDEFNHIKSDMGENLPDGIDAATLVNEDGSLKREYQIDPRFYAEEEKWINNVGRKIHPLHKFWYEGDFYTHIDSNFEVPHPEDLLAMNDYSWRRTNTAEFPKLLIKNGGIHHHTGYDLHKEKDAATRRYHYGSSSHQKSS